MRGDGCIRKKEMGPHFRDGMGFFIHPGYNTRGLPRIRHTGESRYPDHALDWMPDQVRHDERHSIPAACGGEVYSDLLVARTIAGVAEGRER